MKIGKKIILKAASITVSRDAYFGGCCLKTDERTPIIDYYTCSDNVWTSTHCASFIPII